MTQKMGHPALSPMTHQEGERGMATDMSGIEWGPSPASGGGGPSLDELARMAEEWEPARWRAASDAAQVAASYLACHPRVAAVRYPGLRADPAFGRAAATVRGGFGPYVDFLPAEKGAAEGAEKGAGAPALPAGWLRLVAAPSDPRPQVLALEALLAPAGPAAAAGPADPGAPAGPATPAPTDA